MIYILYNDFLPGIVCWQDWWREKPPSCVWNPGALLADHTDWGVLWLTCFSSLDRRWCMPWTHLQGPFLALWCAMKMHSREAGSLNKEVALETWLCYCPAVLMRLLPWQSALCKAAVQTVAQCQENTWCRAIPTPPPTFPICICFQNAHGWVRKLDEECLSLYVSACAYVYTDSRPKQHVDLLVCIDIFSQLQNCHLEMGCFTSWIPLLAALSVILQVCYKS